MTARLLATVPALLLALVLVPIVAGYVGALPGALAVLAA